MGFSRLLSASEFFINDLFSFNCLLIYLFFCWWFYFSLQVAFKGDPEAALIQYLTNEEARKAISSTEAVLNNRFIRVLWHRENNEQPALQSPAQLLLQQQQTLSHLSQPHPHLPQHLHQQQVLVAQSPPSTVHGGVQKVISGCTERYRAAGFPLLSSVPNRCPWVFSIRAPRFGLHTSSSRSRS